ncbi:MAG: hypothetical protein KC493_12975 [Bacteriovoracaceae bacterium]|nr:hypothetical protein [Bacteriovoracaceae bacterium]
MKKVSIIAALAMTSSLNAQDFSGISYEYEPVLSEIDFQNLVKIEDYLGGIRINEELLRSADWCECGSCRNFSDLLESDDVRDFIRGKNPIEEHLKILAVLKNEGYDLNSSQVRVLNDVVKKLTIIE